MRFVLWNLSQKRFVQKQRFVAVYFGTIFELLYFQSNLTFGKMVKFSEVPKITIIYKCSEPDLHICICSKVRGDGDIIDPLYSHLFFYVIWIDLFFNSIAVTII